MEPATSGRARVLLGGTPVDLLDEADAVASIVGHARSALPWALGVMSANLDHLHHFGHGGARVDGLLWAAGAGPGTTSADTSSDTSAHADPVRPVRWISLLDGAPLVRRAARLTGRPWPRLSGSDLIAPLLDAAEEAQLRVGFLGGSPRTLDALEARLAVDRPALVVAGAWSPPRADLEDRELAAAWAAKVRDAHVDLLVVALGKPRQERWIVEHGGATGAPVLLAFGAVVDFLAGTARRAPQALRDRGLEWAFRLALEPRRLARRYLVQGPPALVALERHSFVLDDGSSSDDVAGPPGAVRQGAAPSGSPVRVASR